MAAKKIRLSPKRQAWADQFKPDTLRGSTLPYPITVSAEYSRTLTKLVDQMAVETLREVKALFQAHATDAAPCHGAHAMDASIGSQARILANKLQSRFSLMFAQAAKGAAELLYERMGKASESNLGSSLKDLSGGLTLDTGVMTGPLRDTIKAGVTQSVALFKKIPQDYLGKVNNAVMHSITNGTGLQELVPFIQSKHEGSMRQARNAALDQTRKAYTTINAARMQALNVDTFEWVHSGGSNQPRKYHQETLNGKIFKLSDPPIIDPNTGERGLPGTLPNCHCTMRPVLTFKKDGV